MTDGRPQWVRNVAIGISVMLLLAVIGGMFLY